MVSLRMSVSSSYIIYICLASLAIILVSNLANSTV